MSSKLLDGIFKKRVIGVLSFQSCLHAPCPGVRRSSMAALPCPEAVAILSDLGGDLEQATAISIPMGSCSSSVVRDYKKASDEH